MGGLIARLQRSVSPQPFPQLFGRVLSDEIQRPRGAPETDHAAWCFGRAAQVLTALLAHRRPEYRTVVCAGPNGPAVEAAVMVFHAGNTTMRTVYCRGRRQGGAA